MQNSFVLEVSYEKNCWLLILVLLLGCVIGCQQAPGGQSLSLQTKTAIENAWDTETMGPFPGWYGNEIEGYSGVLYSGENNGYTILEVHLEGALSISDSEKIADCEFKYPELFQLYAFKDGTFYDLCDAYEDGLVEQESIAFAFEKHKALVCITYPNLAASWGFDK